MKFAALRKQPGSAEPRPIPGCTGKFRHESREGARDQAESLRLSGRMYVGERPYLCPHCKGWHVGRRARRK